jgi:16S rRNA (guanine966-N2)-methyltransferase
MQKNLRKKPAPKHSARTSHAKQIRIIGGLWKRTPLAVPDAKGLRPTPDRVRETLFNWLHHLLGAQWTEVTCLDLFAGTGALGFEAASRGAERVIMIEENAAALKQLGETKEKLQARQVDVLRGDALSTARGLAARADDARFDLIFLDPPYHQGWLPRILPACEQLLANGGLVYAESEFPLVTSGAEIVPNWLAGWDVVRADKAGMVFYHLLQRKNSA